jgi:Flp pilus assembly protein TadG
MTVMLIMCAFAIDLATWYQKHHQAQVAADSAALAAANCLANGKTVTSSSGINCNSATDTTDAQSVATSVATTNLPSGSPTVTVNTTSHTVTVTASSTPQVDFAGLISLHPSVSARSVASYATASANYSVFVGNDTCNVNSNGNGGLQIQSNGGGNATVTGLYSDGVIQNNDNSGAANWSGGISDGLTTGGYSATATPMCGDGNGTAGSGGNDNSWQTKNTTVEAGQETAYPQQYNLPVINSSTITSSQPSSAPTVTPGVCTFASSSFSTDGTGIHSMTWPGIYCVTDSTGAIATTYSGSCSSSSDNTTGSIWVEATLEGAYEFVAPCVVGYAQNSHDTGISASIQAINTQTPIVYGTLQTGSPCLAPSTTFVVPGSISYNDSVYLAGNNLTLNGPIYAPCGTAELTKNNAFNTFLEAANVTIDKNNFKSWAGTGPPSVPASDGLSN